MEQFGRYRIVRRIARGGMAEIFEAVAQGAEGFERRVALKRIIDDAGDPSFARMFMDEARITSRLHHGNIVGVLDFGVAEGTPFLVMEFVDGKDASALRDAAAARGEPFPVGIALHICAEVAHALDHAHRATDARGRPLGIVHRDVSPTNILVSWDGDVKLTDFGIAFAHERHERTDDGTAKGKLGYMAPEQATGGTVDARTDVFALGCVLHALVVGQSPLRLPGAFGAAITGDALPLDGDLPEDVRAIVQRATHGERRARYADAETMAAALGQARARRSEEDPRTELRAWLRRVGAPGEARPRGKLDAALDVEALLEGEGAAGPVTEATHAIRPGGEARGRATEAGGETRGRATEAGGEEEPVAAVASGRRAPAWAALFVALLASGLGAYAATRPLGDAAEAADGSEAPVESVEGSASEETAAVEATVGVEEAAEASLAADDATRRESETEREGLAPRDPAQPETGDDTAVETSPSVRSGSVRRRARAPVAPGGAATLVIGGAGALRSEIRIDGRPAGFAPRRLELPSGRHRVALYDAEGRRIAQRTIDLTPRHTPSSPARWIVDD